MNSFENTFSLIDFFINSINSNSVTSKILGTWISSPLMVSLYT
ncbi:hypothetical protein ACV3UL_12220 [Clostridium perfringens]